VNTIAGGPKMCALLIEHIDSIGPYKVRTDFPRILQAIQKNFGAEACSALRDSYERLRETAKIKCPSDLQVLISRSEGFVVIDPELIGGRVDLPAWPADAASV
jgi:hypothetical protein